VIRGFHGYEDSSRSLRVPTPISHKYTALEPYLQLAKMFMLMQFIQDVMCLFSTSCEFAFHKRNTKIKSEEIR
jgi:hypothetical protein